MKIHITTDQGELLNTVEMPDAQLEGDPKAPAEFAEEVKDAIAMEVQVMKVKNTAAHVARLSRAE